ncbi:MAG: homoserine dehydrogenase [Oscillibacter sp.]|nr:homoserine dehydrogenase [Oscillibacter sp.]
MIQIAILGLGTVGTGVAKVVAENKRQIERKLGEPLEVKTVLVRHFKDGLYRQLMTNDFQKIENDPEIRVVVETIGGVEAAYEYTRRALEAGKHVVTANKQLVAEHGCELLELAKRKNVSYLFEASVGGGIPILHPLTQCMAANRIDEIYGILNGTTNYILTRMVRAGATFQDALREAQEKGYAEADPTADVEGIDAGRKICILGDLAFGRQMDPEAVPMEGICKLSLQDVKIAQRAGYRIKLLGRAVRLPGSGRTAYVAPHLIPEDNPIANVEDVFNAVMVRGNATGDVMFYGKGAGELPTASACVADVMECLQASPRRDEIGWDGGTEGFADPLSLKSRHYFRIAGSLADAAAVFGQVEVLSENGETAFLTEAVSGQEAAQLSQSLKVLACMRVLA